MIIFNRYPQVRNLIMHYTNSLQNSQIISIMNSDITNAAEATALAKLICRMANQITTDNESCTATLGRTDNSGVMPDVDYEISLYLGNKGDRDIWDKIYEES